MIPAFNAGAFLPEAIASCYQQTLVPNEVIVVNDGSTDESTDVLASLQRQFGQSLQVIELPKNVGVSEARNIGISAARHEAVAFLDADDVCLPTRFEAQVSRLCRDRWLDAVGSSVIFFGENGVQRVAWAHEDPDQIRVLLAFSCEVFQSTMMARRSSLKGMRFCGREPSEDWQFWARFSRQGSIANLRAPLVMYRRHGAQTTVTIRDHAGSKSTAVRMEHLAWLTLNELEIDPNALVAFSPSQWQIQRDVPLAAFGSESRQAFFDALLAVPRVAAPASLEAYRKVVQEIQASPLAIS